MFGIFPFIATLTWAVFFYLRVKSEEKSWRWSIAVACLLLGTFVLFLTQALSFLHLINFASVFAAWCIYLLFPVSLLIFHSERFEWTEELLRVWSKIKGLSIWMVAVMAVLILVMIRMLIASPPCNYDVQSYHLPRQIFWLMQGSVQHFDATYPYQNSHPVLTEYLGLNLMVLSGGDSWHNLTQFFFFVAACGLTTLITKSIGGGKRAQALTMLFIGMVPVIFFEASNSKNDIVASFYILIPLLIGLGIWNREIRSTVPPLLIAALAAGLAMATKGTAVAYLPASAMLLLIASLRSGAWRSIAISALPGVLIVMLVILPNSLRNLETYGSITGPSARMSNDSHDLGSVVGVAIKNVANQFAFGSEGSIHRCEVVTRSILTNLGLNPDDPYTNIGAAQLGGANLHFLYAVGCEDEIPAPIQTALALLIPLFLMFPAFRRSAGSLALACVVLGSFVLFCAIFRWQPWGGRLLIPAFFMAAPLVGKAEDLFRPRWLPLLITALEMAFLWPQISYTGQRHLLGWWSVFRMPKEEQMSIAFVGRMEEIRKVAGMIKEKSAMDILVDGKDSAIYGLLREVHAEMPQVKLRSGHLNAPGNADGIVESVGGDVEKAPEGYRCDWSGKYFRIYFKDR
jgi:hypothetical protein